MYLFFFSIRRRHTRCALLTGVQTCALPISPLIDLAPEPLARFNALREWRATTAREQNVPAYVIFHDATLRAIAEAEPDDLDALGQIPGDRKRDVEGKSG